MSFQEKHSESFRAGMHDIGFFAIIRYADILQFVDWEYKA